MNVWIWLKRAAIHFTETLKKNAHYVIKKFQFSIKFQKLAFLYRVVKKPKCFINILRFNFFSLKIQIDKNCVNLSILMMSTSSVTYRIVSVGFFFYFSYLQILFSFVLLLGKDLWFLNTYKTTSFLAVQTTTWASSHLFLKAEGSWCTPH